MSGLFYAGIGSRNTPTEILDLMAQWAEMLATRGYVLRSGAADGADAAFERGADLSRGSKEIYLPWAGFNGSAGVVPHLARGEAIVEKLHPAWARLSQGAKKLHCRNAFQVLGMNLNSPAAFVLCWTPDGAQSHAERTSKTGGTGMAISIASLRGIPVVNMARPDWRAHVMCVIDSVAGQSPVKAACLLPSTQTDSSMNFLFT